MREVQGDRTEMAAVADKADRAVRANPTVPTDIADCKVLRPLAGRRTAEVEKFIKIPLRNFIFPNPMQCRFQKKFSSTEFCSADFICHNLMVLKNVRLKKSTIFAAQNKFYTKSFFKYFRK
jgi:hypothetical protein